MRSSDLAFDDWVARARDALVVDVVNERGVRLRGGINKAGPCPACGGRDRFTINTRHNWFYCRGCQKGGDAIELVRLMDACDFLTACETLTGEPSPRGRGEGVDMAELERRRAVREQARVEAERKHKENEARVIASALRFWEHAVPVSAGDPVAGYLAARKLQLPEGADVRFHPHLAYYSDAQELSGRFPAMVAASRWPDGTFRAAHLTYLTQVDGVWRKLKLRDVATDEALSAKKMRGRFWHSMVFLGGNRDADTLVVGEGIETTLSVYRVLIPARQKAWMFGAALSLNNLAALHLPASVKNVVILKDGDSDPATTNKVMEQAVDAYTGAGCVVRIAQPPSGVDFNDMLMGAPHEA